MRWPSGSGGGGSSSGVAVTLFDGLGLGFAAATLPALPALRAPPARVRRRARGWRDRVQFVRLEQTTKPWLRRRHLGGIRRAAKRVGLCRRRGRRRGGAGLTRRPILLVGRLQLHQCSPGRLHARSPGPGSAPRFALLHSATSRAGSQRERRIAGVVTEIAQLKPPRSNAPYALVTGRKDLDQRADLPLRTTEPRLRCIRPAPIMFVAWRSSDQATTCFRSLDADHVVWFRPRPAGVSPGRRGPRRGARRGRGRHAGWRSADLG